MNKIIFILCLFFLMITSTSFAQTNNYEPVTKFDPSRDAQRDINNAIEFTKKTDKRIILDVGGEWCIWCHRIDAFIESHKEIKDYLDKHYVVVKINYSKENKNEKVLSAYPEISGYPHFFVLENDGKLLHSQNTGELEKDKDYDEAKFMSFLKKWSKK